LSDAEIGSSVALLAHERQHPGAAPERQKRQHRHARQQRHHQHDGGRHSERFRIAGKLPQQRLVGRARDARLRHQQAGRC
jgi:hypothetical protein